jgi:hypothetical protein
VIILDQPRPCRADLHLPGCVRCTANAGHCSRANTRASSIASRWYDFEESLDDRPPDHQHPVVGPALLRAQAASQTQERKPAMSETIKRMVPGRGRTCHRPEVVVRCTGQPRQQRHRATPRGPGCRSCSSDLSTRENEGGCSMSFTRIGKAADPRSSRPATGGPPSRSHPDKATQRVEVVTLPNGEAPAARL